MFRLGKAREARQSDWSQPGDQHLKPATLQDAERTFELKANQAKLVHSKRETELDGLKLVIDGASLQCDGCSNPTGRLKVRAATPSTQEKRTATIAERGPASLVFEGNCLRSPNAAVPCASCMQLSTWKDTATVLFQDKPALLQKSTINCLYGGATIRITDSGQRNEPPATTPTGGPLPVLPGIMNGHYYLASGHFIGKIAHDDYTGEPEDVYICKQLKDAGANSLIDKIDVPGSILLKDEGEALRHEDFCFIAYVLAHEAGGPDAMELKCLAFASHNEALNRRMEKNRWKRLLNTGYSSVRPKGKLLPSSVREIALLTRQAIFAVLTGATDPTSGATFWDGTDFLAHGNSEQKPDNKIGSNKFDEYKFIEIPLEIYLNYLNANGKRYVTADKGRHNTDGDQGNHVHVKKTIRRKRLQKNGQPALTNKGTIIWDTIEIPHKISYPIPAADFTNQQNWTSGNFYYLCDSKKSVGISATVSAGKSIFWKTTRVRLTADLK
ncbi:DUF4280 domain-containing protein [Pedobacter sp. SYP-B3415]|uniref:DUF4280 domain-containing protein n=1 Tax=Pedobacter sp. SYP-B3415 TaxID=2496641 RepID=UPI00101D0992|nr:DUF4280 domain-containing protein [Pedobacter sp. SYP-B3415]